MNTAIKTTFLSDQDLSQVQSILDSHGLSGFDASVRLWGRGKAIEVKGTLGRQELTCLLAIARFLGEGEAPAHVATDLAIGPAANGMLANPALASDMPLPGQALAV